MGCFDVCLVYHGVFHGGVDLGMAENFLNLLNGHAFINGSCSHCAAEFMRMNFKQINAAPQFSQSHLYAADFQAVVGSIKGNEQGRVIIGAAV